MNEEQKICDNIHCGITSNREQGTGIKWDKNKKLYFSRESFKYIQIQHSIKWKKEKSNT